MKRIIVATPLVFLLAYSGQSARAAELRKKSASQAQQSAASAPESGLTSFSFVADGSRLRQGGTPAPVVTAFAQGGPIMRPYDERPLSPQQRSSDLRIPVLPPAPGPAPRLPMDPLALRQYALGALAAGGLLLAADLTLLRKAREGDKALREAERRQLHAQKLRADRAERALDAELHKSEKLSQALEEKKGTYETELEKCRAELERQKDELQFSRKRLAVLEEEAEARSKKRSAPVHDDIERAMDADHGSVVWTSTLGLLLDRIDDSVRAIDSHLGPRPGSGQVAQHLKSIDHDIKEAGDLVQNVQTFLRAKSGDRLGNLQFFLGKGQPPLV